jgi:hypothetical protein
MYYVKVKQSGEWKTVYNSYSPSEARLYAWTRIAYLSKSIERVEVHDVFSCVETIYDKNWYKRVDS